VQPASGPIASKTAPKTDTPAASDTGNTSASASASDVGNASASEPTSPPPADPANANADANAPAAAISGPPDPALLQSLPAQVLLFADAVQPLLREKCGKCHIRDKPAGGLNVDQQAQLLEGGFSGPGVVPKDRKASFVMQRIVLPPSNDEHMPPVDEPALTTDEV
jgi:hypothetical protein